MEFRYVVRHWSSVALALTAIALSASAVINGQTLKKPVALQHLSLPKFPIPFGKHRTPSTTDSNAIPQYGNGITYPPKQPDIKHHYKQQQQQHQHGQKQGQHQQQGQKHGPQQQHKFQQKQKPGQQQGQQQVQQQYQTKPTTNVDGNAVLVMSGPGVTQPPKRVINATYPSLVRPQATSQKPILETTTQDRSIISAPLIMCPEDQRMGPDRNCRPKFVESETDDEEAVKSRKYIEGEKLYFL